MSEAISGAFAIAQLAFVDRHPSNFLPDFAEPVIGPRFARTRWLIRATKLVTIRFDDDVRRRLASGGQIP